MDSRNVLLVVLEEVPEDEIRKAIADVGERHERRVVAPATASAGFSG